MMLQKSKIQKFYTNNFLLNVENPTLQDLKTNMKDGKYVFKELHDEYLEEYNNFKKKNYVRPMKMKRNKKTGLDGEYWNKKE